MPGKIKVFYFNNGSGGGVLSVITNLLRHRQHKEIENHVIYTINKEQVKDFRIPGLAGAVSEHYFIIRRSGTFIIPVKNYRNCCPVIMRLLLQMIG